MPGVMPSSLAAYPPVLASADCKGLLRAEMEQGQRLHALIPVATLLPSTARAKTLTGLERAAAGCRAVMTDRVMPLQDQLRAIERAARKAGRAEIAQAASDFARACAELSWEADFQEARKAIVARRDRTELQVDEAAAEVMRASQAYEDSAQRASDWQRLIQPPGQRLSQVVADLPEYRARFWHRFKMFRGFDIMALKLGEEIDRTKRLAVLTQALRQAEAIADHRPV